MSAPTLKPGPVGPYGGAAGKPTLLLLDGHSLAYRAFYALPAEKFATSSGQHTNAVYGFTSMLLNLLRDERPTHVAVAFDLSRQTWRSEEFVAYKANRSSAPNEFKGQVELVREVLNALRIPSLTAVNFEADDVIATLTTHATAQGMTVRICTGDRDAIQLVTPDVTVLYPVKGVSDMTRFTPESVQAKYALSPAQYPDFAALRGDPSDNLPNIPGVGEKTAAKWVAEYGSLATLADRVDEVPGKAGGLLRAALPQVLMNRRLTELVRDVPLDVDPLVDLEAQPYDRDAVHDIFDQLQFRVLRERLLEYFQQTDVTSDEKFQLDGGLLEPGSVRDWLTENAVGRKVGIWVTGTWIRGDGDPRMLSVAAPGGVAAAIDPIRVDADDDAALGAWLADASSEKVGHDVKLAANILAGRGWELRGVVSDTALAAYLALPGQRTFDLSDLVQRYLHRTLTAETPVPTPEAQLSFELDADAESDGAADAAAAEDMLRALAVLDLDTALTTQLTTAGQLDLMRKLELPLTVVLGAVERTGIAVDTDGLQALQSDFAAEAATAAQAAYDAIGHEVNLGSPKQLQVVLFDELQMPKTKRTKTGYTTDADALAALHEQAPHPFLTSLLRHRDVSKLRTTVDGLIKAVGDDGRIHTTYQQTIAITGRLSSTEPNLQNIPVRTDEGRRIRGVFVASDGYESVMTADYSQIEMRIMAHLSKDEGLIEAFHSGEDLHSFVAAQAFNIPIEQVHGEMRRRIKAMTYGLVYGLSAFGLSNQLKISREEAQAQMDLYFSRFGGVREYLRRVVDTARVEGYTETLLGRRRYIPDLTSDNRQRRELAERNALNAPIQGSAADLIKVAMLKVDARIRAERLKSRLLLQVHDELVAEVAPGEQEAIATVLREEMGTAYQLDVPLDVSIGIGHSWEAAAH
ncbi:DNA polymerase I [Nakamurella deserti]|uniref:DNA polymerase I n=1 Tax=Nakamurella deserti TaxID=2164074 RepID=UPI001F0C85D3|nr:DNA polymerase I [Nakamurella deserti]